MLLEAVTEIEVKQVVFNIVEDKHQDLIGFLQAFTKLLLIVGTEVTEAILNFYATGKMLKQINTMLLALIPKVHSPKLVMDFRPISSCNVPYKVISKIIVQKLSRVLDKLISPCQAAFVPSSSIRDNIMLCKT